MIKKCAFVSAGGLIVVIVLASSLGGAQPASGRQFPGGVHDALGPRFHTAPQGGKTLKHRPPRPGVDSVHHWNEIAINASGVDHTPR